MIGGVDIILDTALSPAPSLDIATCAITRLWTDAVFQDAISANSFTSQPSIALVSVHQLLCYRDAVSHQQWDALGAEPSTEDTMIHLLAYDAGRLTIVVDDDMRGDARVYLDALRQTLADRRSLLKNSSGSQIYTSCAKHLEIGGAGPSRQRVPCPASFPPAGYDLRSTPARSTELPGAIH